MKTLTSRQKILLGCLAMLLAIIGDILLGYGTFSTTASPDAYMGIAANVVPDWRYAVSSMLGFVSVPLFAVAVLELLKVMEHKYGLAENRLYKLFKVANWGGILYFAFIHIGICMLPVVFNAGMEATGNAAESIRMTLRVLKSVAVPMAAGFVICDGFVLIAWIGLLVKGLLPIPKIALVCNPIFMALIGQLMNLIREGLDSGFESFGWLLLYLICAMKLVSKDERL